MNGNHHICQNTCCLHELDHLTLRDIADLLDEGKLSMKQAEKVFRRVNDRYQSGNVLRDEELEALGELRMRLTDLINPYTVEQLDKRIAELDAKFPDWQHFYHRIGTIVTWYDRPRSPDHPLWHLYPHDGDDQAEKREAAGPTPRPNGKGRSGRS